MTRPPEPSGEDAAGILRAIGSLLVALSGNADQADPAEVRRSVNRALADADRGAPRDTSRGMPRQRRAPRPAPDTEYVPTPDVVREVDFILSDARERARQILDESMDRAQTLLRPDLRSVPGVDLRAFEDLRQATRGLATEIRDVQRRLARIEALLRASSAARAQFEAGLPLGDPDDDPSRADSRRFEEPPLPTAPARPAAPEPTTSRPFVAPPPQVAPPAYEQPSAAPTFEAADDADEDFEYADEADERTSPPYEIIPPRGRDGGAIDSTFEAGTSAADFGADELPSSAVPRMRAPSPPPPPMAPMAPMAPPAAQPRSEPAPAPEAPIRTAAPRATDTWDEGAEDTLFHPEDGAITVRVSPVSGFQGLMRVHDAIARLAVVRQATVEAYSQGEARLRVDLAEAAEPTELVSELGRMLQEPTSIRAASAERRELFVTLQ